MGYETKINVYGTGDVAFRFIINHPDVHINCCIEGKKVMKEYVHIPVIRTENAYKEMHERYTVVACSEVVYPEIKRLLEEEYGLEEYENFEYWETYGKEIAIVYGNCHGYVVKDMLRKDRKFSDRYGFYPVSSLHELNETNKNLMNDKTFGKYSLFLHQCIRRENIFGEDFASGRVIKKLDSGCKIFGFPNLYGLAKFLYPQTGKPHNCWVGDRFYGLSDYYIDINYNDKTLSELCDMVQCKSLISREAIIDGVKLFRDKIREREKEWDIRISDFIEENIRKHKLFYDPYHPTNYVLAYIANGILNY